MEDIVEKFIEETLSIQELYDWYKDIKDYKAIILLANPLNMEILKNIEKLNKPKNLKQSKIKD